jgi:hypothetical protein
MTFLGYHASNICVPKSQCNGKPELDWEEDGRKEAQKAQKGFG